VSCGIPNELIVRVQQNDTDHPVHIFVMCEDLAQRDVIVGDLQRTATNLDVPFEPDHLHLVPDHTVTEIVGKPKFSWLGTDAMLCRTGGIPREVADNWAAAQHAG
jgi:hypothetical protein